MHRHERVQFNWDSNSEAMVYTEDGEALQGLTGGGERVEWIFPQAWKTDTKRHIFYIEMACNGMFGNADSTSPSFSSSPRWISLMVATGDIIQPPKPDRT